MNSKTDEKNINKDSVSAGMHNCELILDGMAATIQSFQTHRKENESELKKGARITEHRIKL